MTHTKLYWRLREYWSGVVDRFFSAAILMAIGVPSYFIVVWIFPGLELHDVSRRSFKSFVLLYTLALFAAVAVVALVLFIAGRFLTRTIKAWFWRDDA
jgi:hypothetical protein